MADLTKYPWSGNTLVTASEAGHLGVNVYIAGGSGVSGTIPVQIFGSSGSGNTVDITGPLVGGAVHVTGSVWVLNPSSGSGGGDVNITASITLPVSQTNVPATQSVYVVNSQGSDVNITGSDVTLQVSGIVEVSGTPSVVIASASAPVPITGSINAAIIGTVPVTSSQAEPVWITGSVIAGGVTFSGSVSPTPPEAYPNSLDNLKYTRKAQRFDLASDSVNYIGYAVLGADVTASSWTIKRLSFDASGNLEQIAWSSTSSMWSNRGSEVYS